MQPLSSTKSLLCRELVGREHELQDLRETSQRAAMGRPQLVLLAGEAGLGKTKLCRYFMKESRAQHTLVLCGQAILQDQALPFGPFLDAFRRYFTSLYRSLPPSQINQHPALASLPRLFPELAPLFPESLSATFASDGTMVQSQQVVFHSILNALQELEHLNQGLLLLVLEDLHWADETSLELLAFLAQRFGMNANTATLTPVDQSTALMILVTYRVEALSDNPALSRLLLQLRTQRHAYEIHLAPLSTTEHRHCLSAILGQSVAEEFASFLFDWDDGNPFFTEELLGAMAASGQLQMQSHIWLNPTDMKLRLPSSLTDAILERFVRLPAADQEILAYAAVIGRAFDFPLLAALSGLDERALVGVLRRAMNTQLIGVVNMTRLESLAFHEHERYQFRHALTREAIYNQMLAPERRMRHRTVAETIEKLLHDTSTSVSNRIPLLRPDNVNRLLAEHYWQAGLPDKAGPYALHEAEHARRIFAFREERYYLNMAQASLPEDSTERLFLLQRIAMLSLGIYDLADALHWLTLAKTGYQRIGRHSQALQVMANLLFVNWFLSSRSMPALVAEIEASAEVAFSDPDSASRDVETLVAASLLAHYWTVHSQYSRSAHWIRHCFELFESLDDPRKIPAIQLCYITNGWLKAHQRANKLEEVTAEIHNAIQVAGQYSLPDVIMIGHTTLAWLLIYWGRSDEAEQVLQEAAEHEERSGTLLPLFLLGWQRFFSGDQWELGIQQLRQGIERLDQLSVTYLAATARVALAHILLARNESTEGEMHFQIAQSALELNNEYMYITSLWWGLAKIYAAQGDHLQAQEYYERILNRWQTTEDTLVILPILLDGIIFYAETGALVKARQWLAELHSLVHVTDNPVCAAALLEAQGVVHIKEGKLEQAIQALRQAVDAWGKLKRRYQQALTSQRLAELLLAWTSKYSINRSIVQATREEAEHLLEDALLVYERLQIPTGTAAVQALRASTRLDSQQKRRGTLEEKRQPMQGLTQRELQVLSQLAAGKTNKEIATALSLSVGTVELHISHILTKLGCGTRTQAATYAIAQGWVKK